jgi:hypothetical protein
MAKSNIRKNDPQNTTAAARRRGTAEENGNAGETLTTSPKARAPRSRKAAADRGAVDALVANGHGAYDVTDQTAFTTPAGLVDVPHDQIALRAYHLYLERGGRGGDEFHDWITAERQLREQAAGARAR